MSRGARDGSTPRGVAGISRPDFESPGPIASKAWATGVAEKLYKKTTAELAASFDNLPEVECKHAKARLLSCGGIGAQWLAQAPTCHLTSHSSLTKTYVQQFGFV